MAKQKWEPLTEEKVPDYVADFLGKDVTADQITVSGSTGEGDTLVFTFETPLLEGSVTASTGYIDSHWK